MQTCPSGNYWEYYAIAMGSRSQASKTYLEKKLEDFESCDLDALVKHALRALEESCGTRKKDDKDGKLTKDNCTVALVGEGNPLLVLDGEDVAQYVDAIHAEQEEQAVAATAAAAAEMSIYGSQGRDATADMPDAPTGGAEEGAAAAGEDAPASEGQQPMEEG